MGAKEICAAALLASMWGSSFILVDTALQSFAPQQLVFWRLLIASVLLGIIAVTSRTVVTDRGTWFRLLLMGTISQALPWTLFAWGQQTVNSGIAGVYTGVTPLLTIPLTVALTKQRATRTEYAVSITGFTGIILVLQPWSADSIGSILGQLACLAGSISYATSFAYAGVILRHAHDSKTALSAGQALCSTIIMAWPGFTIDTPHIVPHLVAWCAIAALGVISALAYVVNYWLIERVGAVSASVSYYLIPVVSLAVGVIGNSERVSFFEICGTVTILTSLAGLYVRSRRLKT